MDLNTMKRLGADIKSSIDNVENGTNDAFENIVREHDGQSEARMNVFENGPDENYIYNMVGICDETVEKARLAFEEAQVITAGDIEEGELNSLSFHISNAASVDGTHLTDITKAWSDLEGELRKENEYWGDSSISFSDAVTPSFEASK